MLIGDSPEAKEHLKKMQDVVDKLADDQTFKDLSKLRELARIYEYSDEEVKKSIQKIVKSSIERFKKRSGIDVEE